MEEDDNQVPYEGKHTISKRIGIFESSNIETTVGDPVVPLPRRIETCRYPFSVNYASFNENDLNQSNNFEKLLKFGETVINDYSKYVDPS